MSTLIPAGMGLDGLDLVLPEPAIVDAPSGATPEAERSAAVEFEEMVEGDDGWCDWIHPLPGYRMKCCDCGLVHEMQFEIAASNGDGRGFNEGEDESAVIVFRARRATASPAHADLGPGKTKGTDQ